MDLNQKEKHGDVISANAGYVKNTCKTYVLFKRIINW